MIDTAVWTLRARWLIPVSGPPVEFGTLAIRGDTILAVEPSATKPVDVDLGDCVILPGLVNTHTHLDLSGLRGRLTPCRPLPDWLHAVVRQRRQQSPAEVTKDIRAGLAESLRHGVTLVGDIASGGLSWEVLAVARLRSVVQFELLGLTRTRAHFLWSAMLDWMRTHPANDQCRAGLSPHAPYSVRRSLFRAAGALAGARGLPLSVHLAESRDELQLLRDHEGPFRSFLESVGVWDPGGLCAGVGDVQDALAPAPHRLLVHGNYLDPAQVRPGATVVYCPRTHAAFGHDPHPLPRLLAAGVRVALGTDSLASNPDLDILAEARFVRRTFPEVPAQALLRSITLSGAEALGWADTAGSLEPGKSADLVVIPLEGAGDPCEAVLNSNRAVVRTLFRGRWRE